MPSWLGDKAILLRPSRSGLLRRRLPREGQEDGRVRGGEVRGGSPGFQMFSASDDLFRIGSAWSYEVLCLTRVLHRFCFMLRM